MRPIRNSAKAIVIRDGHLLAIRHIAADGFIYGLPGGGQENRETLVDALKRECLEEISSGVDVGYLLFIREYIGDRYGNPGFHQVEFMFSCTLQDGAECVNGSEPDPTQLEIEWLPIVHLDQYNLYPKAIISLLMNEQDKRIPVYLGDVD
ncbi:MAG: NUDIX domain-containing protein [Armatimonadota bacterium]